MEPPPAASNASKEKLFSEIFVFYYNLAILVEKIDCFSEIDEI
jgi:hypothetical protein